MSQYGSLNGEVVILDGDKGDIGDMDPLGDNDADVRLGGVGGFSGDCDERSDEKRDLSGVLDLRSGDELRSGEDET